MKRLILSFLLSMLLLHAQATFTVNGITYNTSGPSTVEVASGNYTGNVTIPTNINNAGVTYTVASIGDHAFMGSPITSVIIPNSVTTIGSYAFGDCTSLTSINIPNLVTYINGVFSGCTSLISITIPNSVTSIGYQSFFNCTSLTTINIPNSVTSIGSNAFKGCTGLTSINIPNSVTSVSSSVFRDCSGLKTITIPNSITSIETSAFANCTGLTTINIASSVTSMSVFAFEGCNGLTSIYLYSKIPIPGAVDFYSFGQNFTTCKLYVPKGALSLYQAASGWNSFTNIIEFDATAALSPTNASLKVYYNSSVGAIEIEGIDSPYSLSAYNLNGILCMSRNMNNGENLPVNLLPKGIYIIKAIINNEVLSRKVVVM